MTLKFFIHNVGHGQAVHAFTPAGESIVVDLGCSGDFSPLEWLGGATKTIDQLIITHPHGDHVDEFLLLKKLGFTVRQLWRPKWLPKEEVYKQNQPSCKDKLDAYFEMSTSYSEAIEKNRLVGNPAVSGGVSVETFSSNGCGVSNINNHSGVVVFKYHGVTVVIPGDNEPASWRALLEQPKFVNAIYGANVFMASHHGRESGYCSDIFISRPNICIVSDGRPKDTDARHKYTSHAKNWNVRKRKSNTLEERACLTTRDDGYIKIEIGPHSSGKGYLSVEVE